METGYPFRDNLTYRVTTEKPVEFTLSVRIPSFADSAEVDDITRLAYKHLTSQPAWRQLPIAPYVANRMAIINNRRGTPDPEILRAFIDTTKYIH